MSRVRRAAAPDRKEYLTNLARQSSDSIWKEIRRVHGKYIPNEHSIAELRTLGAVPAQLLDLYLAAVCREAEARIAVFDSEPETF